MPKSNGECEEKREEKKEKREEERRIEKRRKRRKRIRRERVDEHAPSGLGVTSWAVMVEQMRKERERNEKLDCDTQPGKGNPLALSNHIGQM